MRSPVLFLVFNRPDTTRQVFDRIRSARPPKLYVAADGPRSTRPAEAERCKEVQAIATAVNWPCEVRTLFQDHNLGCKMGVSSGVTWFFNHESEGVILEDDVLPVPTFFDFCDEMLEKYRNEDRIAMINGSNLVSQHFRAGKSYFFSRYPYIWGWASWRRAWQFYDVEMKEWPAWRDRGGLKALSGGRPLVEDYWRHILNATYAGKIDTWDWQWFFACWRHARLTIVPTDNQTSNLGYGTAATHTVGKVPEFVSSSIAKPLSFPLLHPDTIEPVRQADELMESKVFGITLIAAIARVTRAKGVQRRLVLAVRSLMRRRQQT